jgi:hypothetical protein
MDVSRSKGVLAGRNRLDLISDTVAVDLIVGESLEGSFFSAKLSFFASLFLYLRCHNANVRHQWIRRLGTDPPDF